ncbi:hypothetical protein EVAR_68238_1 [Eumeta japonica]|uniref:Uncharacterized protein n=1 Tax=Eumeta variegata TaxID=151549 RepID=A0A4C1ZUH1_EUMVA|nr:hypothetical protein EVAR_68238_1 [Eumeta japonica]
MNPSNGKCEFTAGGRSGERERGGCWARFVSLFDDRGFDLSFEYDEGPTAPAKGQAAQDWKPLDRKSLYFNKPEVLDDELGPDNNFYEQFATLDDDELAEEWRRSSARKPRVSMRPSMHLTNIAEESSIHDDLDNLEVVRADSGHIIRLICYTVITRNCQ